LRIFLWTVVAFLAGFVVAWCGAMAIYVMLTAIRYLHDRDGGGAMATAFVIGPFAGFVTGVIAAIVVARRLRRPPS
jgi:hypothetical protein